MNRPFQCVVLALAMLLCAGCQLFPTDRLPPSKPYPESMTRGATLDVQVAVDRDQVWLALTNTTAYSFESTTLWLNAWYAYEMKPWAIGETRRIRVNQFRDRFGDRMPAGGFFATRQPKPIVLAELESDETLFGLVVVSADTEE